MNIRSSIAAVLPVCLLLLSTLAWGRKDARTTAVEDDIREAVLRYQMTGRVGVDKAVNESTDPIDKAVSKKLNFEVFFISINGEDPSDEFMKRFQNFPRRVEKCSRSEVDKQQMNAVVDKTTRDRGIVFRVETIKWLGANSAEVDGGYFCSGLCASGQTFKVHRKQGVWTVTGSKMHWIS
jgi:hypothetical protein